MIIRTIIKDNCVVGEVLMKSKRKAKGVKYFDKRTGETIEVEAETVIVAAGAIESPKLLLRSRTSKWWREGIGNQNDLVGRNIITHPYYIFQANLPENAKRLQPEMDFPTLCSRYYDSPEEQRQGKFILLNPPSSPDVDLTSAMQSGQTRRQINQMVKGPTTVQIHGMLEIFSYFYNRVYNLNKVNHLGLIETTVDFSKAPDFDQRVAYIQSKVSAIFDAMGATDTSLNSMSWRADHAACTTRMSDNPNLGVTDKWMRIHDTENLYVCSNGSFSTLSTVNPTLTLTALSLRLGDHLVSLKHSTSKKRKKAALQS